MGSSKDDVTILGARLADASDERCVGNRVDSYRDRSSVGLFNAISGFERKYIRTVSMSIGYVGKDPCRRIGDGDRAFASLADDAVDFGVVGIVILIICMRRI